jgi:predicted secreted protein
MSITSSLAIYFIIWWLAFFVVLPFGVKNPHEAGETVQAGHEAGAPVNPRLKQKVVITTLLATVVFAGVYAAIAKGLLLP